MPQFLFAMRRAGPRAVPGLVSLIGRRDVNPGRVFHAIIYIDDTHGTDCYAKMVIGDEISDEARKKAIYFVSNPGARCVVEDLDKLLEDSAIEKKARERAAASAEAILALMAERPNSPKESRNWARTELEKRRRAKSPKDQHPSDP